jgi:hypothetical protein
MEINGQLDGWQLYPRVRTTLVFIGPESYLINSQKRKISYTCQEFNDFLMVQLILHGTRLNIFLLVP